MHLMNSPNTWGGLRIKHKYKHTGTAQIKHLLSVEIKARDIYNNILLRLSPIQVRVILFIKSLNGHNVTKATGAIGHQVNHSPMGNCIHGTPLKITVSLWGIHSCNSSVVCTSLSPTNIPLKHSPLIP